MKNQIKEAQMYVPFRKSLLTVLVTAGFALCAAPAGAAWNAETTGTVAWVGMYTPDIAAAPTVLLRLSNQPTTGCAANDAFSLSPATIPDAQTLKNMIALVLAAKSSGSPIKVAYDSGSACDTTGRPRVYFLQWTE